MAQRSVKTHQDLCEVQCFDARCAVSCCLHSAALSMHMKCCVLLHVQGSALDAHAALCLDAFTLMCFVAYAAQCHGARAAQCLGAFRSAVFWLHSDVQRRGHMLFDLVAWAVQRS